MDSYDAYLSIGDSMSIDAYPYFELSKDNLDVPQNVGAASLLYQNVPEIWPEFEGRDLRSLFPDLFFKCVAMDGATTHDFISGEYLEPFMIYKDKAVLVTLTLSGNDLLRMMNRKLTVVAQEREIEAIWQRYERVVSLITGAFPKARMVLTTIYDPTDGSGELPGYPKFTEYLGSFSKTNDFIRDCAAKSGFALADVHKHFLGHGLSAEKDQRWYWEPNPIEPSARGASEIRRLWLEALGQSYAN